MPDDEDLAELFAAARAGIHAADEMPFGVPWTDGLEEPGALERFLSFHWSARGAITPERWALPFAVVADGRVVGAQELAAEDFAGSRSVSSGSWLTRSAQGRGIGVEMRAAVLQLAFAGLGALEAQTSAWIDNEASQRVSLPARLRAGGRAAAGPARRADAASALPPHARGVAARPLRGDRGARARALPRAARCCMNLQRNLYNHAVMATPATELTHSGAHAHALSAGIAGASGYAGRELARLIAGHPQLTLRSAQARSDGFDALAPDDLARCDVAFLCLPHGASQEFGEAVARTGTPVVDLGSDFRLDPEWAYGLTELFRRDVLAARRIANPGCYATAATLALAPLAEAGPARRAGRDRRQVGRLRRRARADASAPT